MIRYLIILCLLFLKPRIDLCAQEIKPSFEFADFNFEIQNYRTALKEYLRIYYFDRENKYPDIAVKIADCFLLLEDSDNAIKYYQDYLGLPDKNVNEKQDVFYTLIKAFILNNSYKLALSELFQCDSEIIESNSDRYHYYMGMTFLLDSQINKADGSFQKLSYYNLVDSIQYNDAMLKYQKNLKRNHRHAKLWSALLPGLGQTINNDPKDGLNSLAINGALVLLFFEIANSLTTTDAIITIAPWLARFYIGGIKNAALASKNNQIKKSKSLSRVIIDIVDKAAKQE